MNALELFLILTATVTIAGMLWAFMNHRENKRRI